MSDDSTTLIPLWPKEALKKVFKEEKPESSHISKTDKEDKNKKNPIGAGRAVFGSKVETSASQGAGKTIFGSHSNQSAGKIGMPLSPTTNSFAPKTVGEARDKFLATEASQYLKLQKERMEKTAVAAERQRLTTDLARANSVLFVKKQELQRIEIRQRAIDASIRAATVNAARAKSAYDTATAAARDRDNERHRLQAELAASDRDFDRRILAEKKNIETAGKEINQLSRQGIVVGEEVSNLHVKKSSHEKGANSIVQERRRRESEAKSHIYKVSKEFELQNSRLRRAEQDLTTAESLLARYKLQTQALKASRSTVEADVERSRREVDKLQAAIRRLHF